MARWATEYERTTPAPTLDELAKFDRGRSRMMLITWAGDDQTGSGISHYKAEVSQVGDGAAASQATGMCCRR